MGKVPELDIRDVSIINSFPHIRENNTVLNVGCGMGRIDWHISKMGFDPVPTDFENKETWEELSSDLTFSVCDIFDLNSFPDQLYSIVICSEVLEHLTEYKQATKNLLSLAYDRLIITVPYKESYNDLRPPPIGHCNYFDDKANGKFTSIEIFKELCMPYSTSISKIRTKPRDVEMNQWDYLIVVDMQQKYG